MYKNLVYYNTEKSIKKYENKLIESNLFNDVEKIPSTKHESIYKNKEVLIFINKKTVSFLVYNQKNISMIDKIESFVE